MKRLLIAALALCLPSMANAATINVGVNPTSATGHFSNVVGGGLFTDYITFQLVGSAPVWITFASATNDYAQPSDFITNFTGQLFEQVGAPGGGDDIPMGPLVNAVGCQQNPGGCQILAGSAQLPAASYYLNLSGTGGGTSGYGGNITTFAVPGPLLGAGLPGLIAACGGLVLLARRRRRA